MKLLPPKVPMAHIRVCRTIGVHRWRGEEQEGKDENFTDNLWPVYGRNKLSTGNTTYHVHQLDFGGVHEIRPITVIQPSAEELQWSLGAISILRWHGHIVAENSAL